MAVAAVLDTPRPLLGIITAEFVLLSPSTGNCSGRFRLTAHGHLAWNSSPVPLRPVSGSRDETGVGRTGTNRSAGFVNHPAERLLRLGVHSVILIPWTPYKLIFRL